MKVYNYGSLSSAWGGRLIGLTLLGVTIGLAFAQDGVSTASEARTKYLGTLGEIPQSHQIAVEDFVNYHRHDIGRPRAGEAVGMDVRWAKEAVAAGGEAILQVGLSTGLESDRQNLRPLNLGIVIDKSGSMADDNKLVRVKEALMTLVKKLRSSDVLSIVVFDSEASVLLPAERVTDKESVENVIREIEPGSATNLSGGLVLGYEEVLKNYRRNATNRVMLLTDGIANRGITDPGEIAEQSGGYNDRGIDLSTIGVGRDVNQDFLRRLAKSGRGLFHFVADSEDIQKVFDSEFQSLVSPVAEEPNLEVSLDPSLRLEKVYGYSPQISGNRVSIKLDNMNSGMTEVVLLRVQAPAESDQSKLSAKATLKYFDLVRKQEAVTADSASISLGEVDRERVAEDSSVAKNYTIAALAQAIKDMAAACEGQRYRQAESCLDAAIANTYCRYPHLEDPDIDRVLKIALNYQGILRKQVGDRDIEEDKDVRLTPKRSLMALPRSEGENLIVNGDFALGNCGFSSDIPYIAPADNCLWGGYYTMAPSFNQPQLHHLVPGEAYAAPRQSAGNEEVFFANTGRTDTMMILETQAQCRPKTTYRISFQVISLSDGVEWIPSFEIRVNGARSEPQAAGMRSYREVSFLWNSGASRTATVKIMRMLMSHWGGLIGIANLEMVPASVPGRTPGWGF